MSIFAPCEAMVKSVVIDKLLQSDKDGFILLDVRSPSEYLQGHIPGAISFPLFSDPERAEVGIAYKQQSPDHAMKLGLHIVGPKMEEMVEQARSLSAGQPIIVHCWRGGKRSGSVAWLLDFAGLPVTVLEGGYKTYRTFQRSWYKTTHLNLLILGGKTGSGKTEILQQLKKDGEQVLDLEMLAHHKGSAFGWIGEEEQPTTEQFENDVFAILYNMDVDKHIWVENESRTIGRVFIPELFWEKMCAASLIHIDVPLDERVQKLVDIYARDQDKQSLIASFQKIDTRLGGQHVKTALEALGQNDYHRAAEIALTYYDKTYYYGLEQSRARIISTIDASKMPVHVLSQHLITQAKQVFHEPQIK